MKQAFCYMYFYNHILVHVHGADIVEIYLRVAFPVQAVFLGCMAISTLRMKFLWTPYMGILLSVGICDENVCSWLLNKLNLGTKNKVRKSTLHSDLS